MSTAAQLTSHFPGTLADLFAEQVCSGPNRLALRHCGTDLTYAELDSWSDAVAQRLRSAHVGAGHLVGLCADRSPALLAALLGLLKVGAAHVALDPEVPRARREQILAASRPDTLLCAAGLWPELDSSIAAIDIPDNGAARPAGIQARASVPDDALFHVVFTSGTTGAPKGVRVKHGSVRNRLEWMWRAYPFAPHSVMCIQKSYSLVASPWEMLGGLLQGVPSVMLTREQVLDPMQLYSIVEREGITHMFLTPQLIENLLDEHEEHRGDLALRLVTSGADVLPVDVARRFHAAFPGVTLLNLYGMTECSSNIAAFDTAQLGPDATRVPVGRPIGGAVIRVVDKAGRVVPVGVQGQIVVAGAAVADGYHRDAALTEQCFRCDADGTVWYQTGDYGRWSRSGDLELIGRLDNQVQIRGFRVELEDVELMLRGVPGVADAGVVAVHRDGELTLVSFICGDAVDLTAIRAALLERWPEYMVPTTFLRLDRLPVGQNGKLDRSRLAALAENPQPEPVAPIDLTETEQRVAKLWQDVLGAPPASRDADFFGSGGHSLLAVRLVSRMRAEFRRPVPLSLVFQDATLRGLAAAMQGGTEQDSTSTRDEPKLAPRSPSDVVPLTFQQEGVWNNLHDPAKGSFNVRYALRLVGELDVDSLRTSIDELVRRHESLRTRIVVVNGVPRQEIDKGEPGRLTISDFTTTPQHEIEAQVARLAAERAQEPLDLAAGPAFKPHLFKIGNRDHVLLLVTDHLFMDGFSQAILLRELTRLYRESVRGETTAAAAPVPVQYADYAVWQRSAHGYWLAHHQPYWTKRLSGARPIRFPQDEGIGPVTSHAPGSAPITLTGQATDRLRQLCQQERTTLPLCLLAALAALLSRWCDTNDVVVPFNSMGRHTSDVEQTIGYFAHTLYMRLELTAAMTYRDVLRRTIAEYVAAMEHVDFGRVAAAMPHFAEWGSFQWNPPFILDFQADSFGEDLRAESFAIPFLPRPPNTKFLSNTIMVLSERGEGVAGSYFYRSDLFKASTIASFVRSLEHCCRQFAEDPDCPIGTAFARHGDSCSAA